MSVGMEKTRYRRGKRSRTRWEKEEDEKREESEKKKETYET